MMLDNQALCYGSAVVIIFVAGIATLLCVIISGKALAWLLAVIVALIAIGLGMMVVRYAV